MKNVILTKHFVVAQSVVVLALLSNPIFSETNFETQRVAIDGQIHALTASNANQQIPAIRAALDVLLTAANAYLTPPPPIPVAAGPTYNPQPSLSCPANFMPNASGDCIPTGAAFQSPITGMSAAATIGAGYVATPSWGATYFNWIYNSNKQSIGASWQCCINPFANDAKSCGELFRVSSQNSSGLTVSATPVTHATITSQTQNFVTTGGSIIPQRRVQCFTTNINCSFSQPYKAAPFFVDAYSTGSLPIGTIASCNPAQTTGCAAGVPQSFTVPYTAPINIWVDEQDVNQNINVPQYFVNRCNNYVSTLGNTYSAFSDACDAKLGMSIMGRTGSCHFNP